MTFTQVGLLPIISLTGVSLFAKIISWGFKIIVRVLTGVLLGSVLMGLVSVLLMNYYYTGNDIYTATLWGAKWASYGIFFGILQSSTTYLYNQQLAQEVVL